MANLAVPNGYTSWANAVKHGGRSLHAIRKSMIRDGVAGKPKIYETQTDFDTRSNYREDAFEREERSPTPRPWERQYPTVDIYDPDGRRTSLDRRHMDNLRSPVRDSVGVPRIANCFPRAITVADPEHGTKSPPLSSTLGELASDRQRELVHRAQLVGLTVELSKSGFQEAEMAPLIDDNRTNPLHDNTASTQSNQASEDDAEIDLDPQGGDADLYKRNLAEFQKRLDEMAFAAEGRSRRGSLDSNVGFDEGILGERSRSPARGLGDAKPQAHFPKGFHPPRRVGTDHERQRAVRRTRSHQKIKHSLPRGQQLTDPNRRTGSVKATLRAENVPVRELRLLDHLRVTEENWSQIRRQLERGIQSRIRFCPEQKCWTLNLATVPANRTFEIPTHVAGVPVQTTGMLSIPGSEFPEATGKRAADNFTINPRRSLTSTVLDRLFDTFKKARSAAVLFDGTLLLVYDKPFNRNVERMNHPATFGGLKVDFVHAMSQMTAGVTKTSCEPVSIDVMSKSRGIEIRLGTSGERAIGCLSAIYASGIPPQLASLGLRIECIQGTDRGKHAVTMATHCILLQHQQQRGRENATVRDLKDIRVYTGEEKIGVVHRCFDHPNANGTTVDFDHDIALLAADKGKEKLLPDLTFRLKNRAEIGWLDTFGAGLNLEQNQRVVLLGRTIEKKERPAGDNMSEGIVEFGTNELREALNARQAEYLLKQGIESVDIDIHGEMYTWPNRKIREYTKAVLWRPNLKHTNKLPNLRDIFASGCPLAIVDESDPAAPKYKVFGFQMSQFLPGALLDDPDDPYKLSQLAGENMPFYVASSLPEELVRDWRIRWQPEGKTIQPALPNMARLRIHDHKGKAISSPKTVEPAGPSSKGNRRTTIAASIDDVPVESEVTIPRSECTVRKSYADAARVASGPLRRATAPSAKS